MDDSFKLYNNLEPFLSHQSKVDIKSICYLGTTEKQACSKLFVRDPLKPSACVQAKKLLSLKGINTVKVFHSLNIV